MLVEIGSGASPGSSARRPASGASSRSASGLPPVARNSGSTACAGDVLARQQLGGFRAARPRTRSTRRSEPSSSDGSPSRAVRTSAIGIGQQPPGREQHRRAGGPVEQMGVVDQQHDRRLVRVGGEQAQRGRADREPVLRGRRPERQRTGERRGLRRRDAVERAERGAQQLGEPGERDRRLGLDAARPQDRIPSARSAA